MKIIVTENYEKMSEEGAKYIAALLKSKPNCILGLATGSSPIGTYKVLAERCAAGDLDFSQITSVNLDEYKGLTHDNDQSYYYFMNDNLFSKVNIDLNNTYVPDGMIADADEAYYSPTEAAKGEEAVAYTDEQVTAILESVSPAQVWTEGYTYYYTNIQHFGSATGMVRNHVYEVTISAITGLGTPVYNPAHIITPEEPEEQEALNIAAQINILSWHVVSQSVSLGK